MLGARKVGQPRKNYYHNEIKRIKAKRAQKYRKAFIFIGDEIDRWNESMKIWGISRNSDFAKFLLDRLDIEKNLLEQGVHLPLNLTPPQKNYPSVKGSVKKEMEDERNLNNDTDTRDPSVPLIKQDVLEVYPGENIAESAFHQLNQVCENSGDGDDDDYDDSVMRIEKNTQGNLKQPVINYYNIQHEHIAVGGNTTQLPQQANPLPDQKQPKKLRTKKKKGIMKIPSQIAHFDWDPNYDLSVKKYKCGLCGKRYKDKACFLRHEKKHAASDLPLIECDHCDKKFKNKESYLRHWKSIPGVKPYQCHFCEEKFQFKKECYQHEVNKHGPKPYKCQHCHMAFSCNSALTVHERYHTGERPFGCRYCGKKFFNPCHQRDHEIIHKIEESADNFIFPCDVCGKIFRRERNLKSHKLTHAPVKPHQCQFCEKSFICKTNLRSHEKLHIGEKNCQCQYCEKTFVDKHCLKRHEKLHRRQRSFQCQFCSKMFLAKKDVARHEMIHRGEKPYQCQYCEKLFSQKGNCVSHERTHTGEKPYKCSFCYMAFAHNVSRVAHEKSHHSSGV